jgi:hypothetical protein
LKPISPTRERGVGLDQEAEDDEWNHDDDLSDNVGAPALPVGEPKVLTEEEAVELAIAWSHPAAELQAGSG